MIRAHDFVHRAGRRAAISNRIISSLRDEPLFRIRSRQ